MCSVSSNKFEKLPTRPSASTGVLISKRSRSSPRRGSLPSHLRLGEALRRWGAVVENTVHYQAHIVATLHVGAKRQLLCLAVEYHINGRIAARKAQTNFGKGADFHVVIVDSDHMLAQIASNLYALLPADQWERTFVIPFDSLYATLRWIESKLADEELWED